MRKISFSFGLFLIAAVGLTIAFSLFDGAFTDFSAQDLFTSVISNENIASLTNASREAEGLATLKISPTLQKAAQSKAEDMLKNVYFSHDTPNGKTPWQFMNEAGYRYLFAGENLAMNFQASEEVMNGWLTSVEHRANILDSHFSEIGVGVAKGKFLGADTTMVVQMFGAPLPSTTKHYLVENLYPSAVKQKIVTATWTPRASTRRIYLVSQSKLSISLFFEKLWEFAKNAV